MEVKQYKCTIGKSVKEFTLLISLIIFSMPVIHYFMASTVDDLAIVITLLLFFGWGVIYSLMPKSVTIYEDRVVVKRLFKDFVIPIETIVAVTQNEKHKFMEDSRRIAIVGLFGYYGYFKSPNYGRYYCISNNKDNNIFLMTTKGSFQISCNTPSEAVLTISSHI